MVKIQKKIHYKGTILVEAAIVFPLLLLLTLGAIEYGWIFLKSQQITNAARQAARVAIRPDATTQDVLDTIDRLMTAADMAGKYDPPEITPGVSVGPCISITVKITVPCANIALINAPDFLPIPEKLRAAVTMSKEGPSGGL